MKWFQIALCLESTTTTVIQNEELEYEISEMLIISFGCVKL